MEVRNPRFIIRFREPVLTPDMLEEFRRIWNGTGDVDRTAMIVGGKGAFDILDLESNIVWSIDEHGIRRSEEVRLIGDRR